LSPFPSVGVCVRNVENGLLWITIRNRKNISVAETTATTHGISSRFRSRLVATASVPKTDSRNTQNMIDPSRPPQYDANLYASGCADSEYRCTYLMAKFPVTNAWMMITDATVMSAATR